MKKDIPVKKVTDVAIAILPQEGDADAEVWDVYLINLKKAPITNVLITSKGFGELEGNAVKTTEIRRFFEQIEARTCKQVELLPKELFGIANQFWVSFNFDDYMFDRKYTFVAGSIAPDNLVQVPFLERPGIMIL